MNNSRTSLTVKAYKQKTAKERQEYWDSLTPQQKLDDLDRRLGKNVGAKKQRARLAKQLKEENS